MRVIDDGRLNPVIVLESDEVLAWLRSKADEAGYADRASCAVQIKVEQPFGDGLKLHMEVPSLMFMVSNIRKPK